MKSKFLLSMMLTTSITAQLTPCEGSERPDNDFLSVIEKHTQLTLHPEKFTSELSGYTVPLFSLKENNRNHFDDRPEGSFTPIKSLVMHYTACNTPATLNLFTKDIPDNRVSASYVITETDNDLGIPGGKVIRMVPDDKRSWHAGVSKWREITNLNSTSIGIENVNKGFTGATEQDRVWYSFDKDQIHALGLLSKGIVKKNNISPIYVVGHADIAPDRKQDPGILFPWGTLYENYGVGAWLDSKEINSEAINSKYTPKEPLPTSITLEFLSSNLKQYGYNVEPTSVMTDQLSNVLKAFKSHFSCNQQPEKYTSKPDNNDMFWIWALNAKYKTY